MTDEKELLIKKIAETSTNDMLKSIEQILVTRKTYSFIYLNSGEYEKSHTKSDEGIEFCNSAIKRLLALS